jgi:hypothetical protein
VGCTSVDPFSNPNRFAIRKDNASGSGIPIKETVNRGPDTPEFAVVEDYIAVCVPNMIDPDGGNGGAISIPEESAIDEMIARITIAGCPWRIKLIAGGRSGKLVPCSDRASPKRA